MRLITRFILLLALLAAGPAAARTKTSAKAAPSPERAAYAPSTAIAPARVPASDAIRPVAAALDRATVVGAKAGVVADVAERQADAFREAYAAARKYEAARPGAGAEDAELLDALAMLEAERLAREELINVLDEAIREGAIDKEVGMMAVDELLASIQELNDLMEDVLELGTVSGGSFGSALLDFFSNKAEPVSAAITVIGQTFTTFYDSFSMTNEEAAWDLEERTGMDINGDGCKGSTEHGRCAPFDEDDPQTARDRRKQRGEGIIATGIPGDCGPANPDGCWAVGATPELDFDPSELAQSIGALLPDARMPVVFDVVDASVLAMDQLTEQVIGPAL